MILYNYKMKGENMERISFIFDETGETVVFLVLSSVQYNEQIYLMVVEEEEYSDDDNTDMTAYIIKAIEQDDEDVIYEIVDDENELNEVSSMFDDILENFDIDQE